jgi:hypothetical protein
VNPLPPPPAPVQVRIARPKRMDNKESSNLRSATNLIQKRDKRSNG